MQPEEGCPKAAVAEVPRDAALSELSVYLLAPLVGALVGWAIWRIVVLGDTDFRDDLRESKAAATG
ncbi:MAG: hypothetical protein HKN80_12200 [Acidimicrobiia bacterium]|nr:hypothetical protein [Acidimicrobiia bacterium]